MCYLNYTYVGPALLVLPLFVISLVNLFVAGPPLKTIVLDSAGPEFSASLPFMRLDVTSTTATFKLTPKDEMTHFFVVSTFTPPGVASGQLALDAMVTGKKTNHGSNALPEPLNHVTSADGSPSNGPGASHGAAPTFQLLQPLLGFTEYDVLIKIASASSGGKAASGDLPTMEYRLTYVPTRFTYTQACVRALFTITSLLMLIGYSGAMCALRRQREPGQLWMTTLLVLLVALNDPLYIARVYVGGNHYLYMTSVFGQISFSGGLFLFWLVYADGMSSSAQRGVCFYLPKIILVAMYVGVSTSMFVQFGRLPDRINMSDAHGLYDLREYDSQTMMVIALCASVIGVGVWLSLLVSQAVYRLGWKKVEYIYTEREKSFVGITIVFVILSLCGHLYRAVHGRRGSWMQLQLPFLTLTNSYLTLLTHAFWPSEEGGVAPAEQGDSYAYGEDAEDYAHDGQRGRGQSLLVDDDE